MREKNDEKRERHCCIHAVEGEREAVSFSLLFLVVGCCQCTACPCCRSSRRCCCCLLLACMVAVAVAAAAAASMQQPLPSMSCVCRSSIFHLIVSSTTTAAAGAAASQHLPLYPVLCIFVCRKEEKFTLSLSRFLPPIRASICVPLV